MPALPDGLCVLLVEDNPQVREFAEGLLVDLGCEVTPAETGEEALRLLEGKAVDLVLSDVVMPGMSGVELARRIRDSHPDVPVLLATGYSDAAINVRGDFPILRKPYEIHQLSQAIARLSR